MQWSQNLCRTCGQISETCHNIYKKDVPSALESKIKQCLHLKLNKGDYKPKQICNDCVLKLNDFAEFLDTCHKMNEKFESIYFTSQTWQNRNFEYLSPQKQSVIVSNKQVADNLDFELYKNTGIVLENLNTTNCQLNDAEMLNLVGNGKYKTRNRENCINVTKWKGHGDTVLRHPAREESAERKCNGHNIENDDNQKICYIRYNDSYADSVSSNAGWVKEVDVKMEKKRTVTVDSVRKSIKLPENKKFIQTRKPKKIYPCPHCSKIFQRSSALKSHMAVHTQIRPYKCEECCKTFPVKSQLTTHKKAHGDYHKCPFCQKKFSAPSKLERHIRIHTNDKPYVCTIVDCRKSFSDKRNLDSHKLTHVREKNYSCVVCNKMFNTLNRLKRHSKCHTNSMRYSCDMCSKSYKYKSNLISHIKKHNNICPYCKKNCESNVLLTEHLKTCTYQN